MISIIVDGINLAGAVASILSYPLIAIPILVLLLAFQAGKPMSSRGKKIAIGVLVLGAFAYAVDTADRLGASNWILNQLPLVDVHDKTFMNTRVPLDGYSYSHCKFINVTFVINGSPRGAEIKASQVGTYNITSDSIEILSTLSTLNEFGVLKIPLVRDGKIVPPGGTNNTRMPWTNPPLDTQ